MAAAPDPLTLAMCSYCGCRSITLIARYSAEHDAIINATGVMRRAAATGDKQATRAVANHLATLLDPHVLSEERSLFSQLRLDPEFTEHIEQLCSEHHSIAAGLTRVADGDLASALALETLLRRHIDKEENGLFPAAAIALDGPAWEQVVARA